MRKTISIAVDIYSSILAPRCLCSLPPYNDDDALRKVVHGIFHGDTEREKALESSQARSVLEAGAIAEPPRTAMESPYTCTSEAKPVDRWRRISVLLGIQCSQCLLRQAASSRPLVAASSK